MKAAILRGPRDFRLEDVSDPELKPDGVIVRIETCGICGSELPMYQLGRWPDGREHPIDGHEWSGEVIEVGTNVTNLELGDRITIFQYGGFAEYIGIDNAKHVYKLPDNVSYEEGATIDPLGVSLYVATTAEPDPSDTAVVLGAGTIGQGVWQAFKAMGVSRTIVTDVVGRRLEVAKELGVDVAINSAEEDPVARVKEITSGKGADIVVDAAGYAQALQHAFEMVRERDAQLIGGKVLVAASYFQPVEVTIQPRLLLTKNLKVIGCVGGMMREALDLIHTGKVNVKPLITHEFPLDQINEAFEAATGRDDSIKVMVKPHMQ